MTQRYSLGHKALSVALSVVLMGFGWPAVSPSQVYAGDGAAADDAAVQVERRLVRCGHERGRQGR